MMEQSVLIDEITQLLNKAAERCISGDTDEAQASLVKMRELLNSQPQLEAGGAAETKEIDELLQE